MENSRILNGRKWSLMRKAQVIATLTRTGLMLGVLFLVHTGNVEGEGGSFAFCLSLLWDLLLYPTVLLFHLLNVPWRTYFATPVVLWQLGAAVLVNIVLLFLLGTLIGWLATEHRNVRK
jgi:hypothetical protein